MKPTIEELNEKLTRASKLLNESATLIRDLDFYKETNIRKIGEALVIIFDVTHQIYKDHPELAPEFLKDIYINKKYKE
ncbi:MAG: hypothetical protein M1428_04690 [Deltaproteobacteria bacterium]|nr:hypothetical protein [Deltaproteobacteria bacterium]